MMRLAPPLLSLLLALPPLSAQEGRESGERPRPMPRPGAGGNRGNLPGQDPFTARRRVSDMDRALARHDQAIQDSRRFSRPSGAPRIDRIEFYPGTRVVIPFGWDRAVIMPDQAFWGQRNIMADIQVMARTGFIPATPIPADVVEVTGVADHPAGWKAYALAVPPRGQVTFRVSHSKPGWFRLILTNQWSTREEGMLVPAGEPMFGMLHRTYTNPSSSAKAVYLVVDDPGWWSSPEDPFRVQVERSWDPASTDLSSVKFASGIWGAQPSISAEHRKPTLRAVGH